MSLDEAITAAVAAAVAPLAAELRATREELKAVRAALPAPLRRGPEAAEALGIGGSTLRAWARRGWIKSTKRGRTVLYDVSSVRPIDDGDVAALAGRARRGGC